jgi:hypothetical protein
MTTSGDAARIKIWSGNIPSNNSTSSGGGTGYVRNVTYNTIYDASDNCELRKFNPKNMRVLIGGIDAIELTQCYSLSNLTLCNEYPVSHHFGLLCPKSWVRYKTALPYIFEIFSLGQAKRSLFLKEEYGIAKLAH